MECSAEQRIELTVSREEAGTRIDRFLATASSLTRTSVQGLIEKGFILLNGKVPAKSCVLQEGDVLLVTIPPPQPVDVLPQDIPLDIVCEDAYLLVVNKRQGMVVHPAPGNADETLVNALLHHCKDSLSGIGGEIRPGIVHRIDKDTSGLLVVAKDDRTHAALSAQFAEHSITRCYHAVVAGHLPQQQGSVSATIGRDPNNRKRMASDTVRGKRAVTRYEVLQEFKGYSYVALRLETGRTHQIRVHMKKLGHPIAGDALYGPSKIPAPLQGQCLHAKTLGFIHPASGEYMEFDSELPEYFKAFLARLEREMGE